MRASQLLANGVFSLLAATVPVCAQIYTFDVPGEPTYWSCLQCINPSGSVTGAYQLNYVYHGFVRSPQGAITAFDPPNSDGTVTSGINPSGAITGQYGDQSFIITLG